MRKPTTVILAALVLLAPVLAKAADPATECEAAKLKVSSKYAACLLNAEARAVGKGAAPNYSKCNSKFSDLWRKTEAAAGMDICPSEGDETAIRDFIGACDAGVAEALAGGVLLADPVTCEQGLSACNASLGACNSDLGTCNADLSATNAALATCKSAVCGNGVLEDGEDCEVAWASETVFDTGSNCLDMGFDAGSLACGAGCAYDTSGCRDQVCGDGIVEAPEECDDGNTVGGDGCDPTCVTEAACLSDPTICDDGNPCTIDSCDPGQGCVYVDETDGEPCDDGNACTVNDMCSSGSCTSAQQLECDDQKVCTTDTCNEVSGCVYTSTCSNGQSCEQSGCVSTSPCANYVTLVQTTRRDTYRAGSVSCDALAPEVGNDYFPVNKWFRIVDADYRYVPESSPGHYYCGTHAPIWMSGSHPTRAQGIITRTLCAHWGATCLWTTSINVMQCSGYFVYKVPIPISQCDSRLCSTRTIPANLQ